MFSIGVLVEIIEKGSWRKRASFRRSAAGFQVQAAVPTSSPNLMKTSLISLSVRVCAAAWMLTFAQWSSAHAYPKQRAPAAGARVGANTKQVSVEFDDALEPAFSSLKVANAAGNDVTDGKSRVDANDKKRMTVALKALTAGVYTVHWTAVAVDGHRTQGHYTFTVK